MRSHSWFLLIVIIYLLGFFSHAIYLRKTVYGDGIYYYSWLRSAVIDHDFNFRDEYRHFDANQPRASNGLPGNKYSVGPAILWTPTFLWVNSLVRETGYEFLYQLAIGFTSVLYAIFGLILLFQLLMKFFPDEVSKLTILGLALSTNLFYYGSLDTVNSHALSFFSVTVFLYLLLRDKKNWLLLGLSLGLIALIRPQDLVVGLLLLPFLKPGNLPVTVLGTVSGFLPQLVAWQTLYGKFWVSPYLTGNEGFNFFQPHIFEVLFSPWYGLFFFSPILVLGLSGLFFWKNQLKPAAVGVLLLELLLIASWSTWWQGASLGGRMFISVLPIFALGVGHAFTWFKKYSSKLNIYLLTLIIPLSLLNFILTFSYLLLH